MFMFVLLSAFLVLLHICIVGDDLDWEPPRQPASIIITKIIHGHALYIESGFHENLVQPPRRRLLEHPHWIKQAYRGNDYNVVRRRRQPQNKFRESRSYRSAAKNNEDEDEDNEDEEEEEEEEEDEEDKIDNEETEDQDENEEEETVAAVAKDSGSGYRIARSDYVPIGDKVGESDKQQDVGIRSVNENCEDESTESPQYYEYETVVRNVATKDDHKRGKLCLVKMVIANFLILMLT